MLGMLVEIARAEQMAATGFDVVGLHPPSRVSRSRSHEHQNTNREKAYLFPLFHIYLLFQRSCLVVRKGSDWFSSDERDCTPLDSEFISAPQFARLTPEEAESRADSERLARQSCREATLGMDCGAGE